LRRAAPRRAAPRCAAPRRAAPRHAMPRCDHACILALGTAPRVHLIFDYVDTDEAIPPLVTLGTAEPVVQTRRSIDLVSDAGKRPCPSFCIIGAQKAGTTSVYE